MITLIFDILGYLLVTFCIIWGLVMLYHILDGFRELFGAFFK